MSKWPHHVWPTWREAHELVLPGYYVPTLSVEPSILVRVVHIQDKKDKILKNPGYVFFGPLPEYKKE